MSHAANLQADEERASCSSSISCSLTVTGEVSPAGKVASLIMGAWSFKRQETYVTSFGSICFPMMLRFV